MLLPNAMKKLILILILLLFIYHHYPSYVVSSGDVLDKGKASINIGVFAPLINPGVVRYGIGNKMNFTFSIFIIIS